MSEYYHYSIKAVPGVEKACPFIYYTVERQIGDKSRHFSIVGYDIFAGLGGPQRLVAGRGCGRPIMKWWLTKNSACSSATRYLWASIPTRWWA